MMCAEREAAHPWQANQLEWVLRLLAAHQQLQCGMEQPAVVGLDRAVGEVRERFPGGLDEHRRPLGDRAELACDAARRENERVVASILEELC